MFVLQAWISFAPVAYPAAEYYHTSANVINGLSIVFMVATIPFGLLAIWVLDSYGLRAAVSYHQSNMSICILYNTL